MACHSSRTLSCGSGSVRFRPSRRPRGRAMSAQDTGFNLELSRRKLLAAAGIGGGAVVAASLIGAGDAEAAAPVTPIARSGGDTSGRRTASAVRRGCIVGDGGVLAHAATRSQSPCRARASRWQARANGRGQSDQLHRCQVRPGRLRLSCEARSTAGRLLLICYGAMHDGADAGVRYVPHLVRVVARRSPSPASAIRARRPWARSSCRPPG